jgi:TDG/mug DNA glycosylase family protein
MPSVISLQENMYYANKTNRFWPMLEQLYQLPTETLDQKLEILQYAKIALWDICHSCVREKSADSTIKEVEPNDIPALLTNNPSIQTVICNGRTSYLTLKKYYPELAKQAVVCPSTSAANARFRLHHLMEAYGKYIGERNE